ncbi:AAA family ATPase [Bradyrhizobium liaoningense]|uniref:AAA family ATPase n=1 Tax=Bradyrhizobium liaoningense TaxID=43992 RepID=UPI001BA9ECE4|nr:AAA family ATPase [Bradyrhizobium liaoningense]MBR0735298.1 AAA family ATPase [Bradyrhizobium liaoningense]
MNFVPKLPAPATFQDLWAMGYRRLVPVIPPDGAISETSSLFKRVGTSQDARGKVPGVKGLDGRWHSFDWTQREADEADLRRWAAMEAGIGVKMGEGLHLIDADSLDKAHAALIQQAVVKHIGVTPCRIGNFPKAGYLCRVSEPIKYCRVDFGPLTEKNQPRDRVEILSDGRFAVFHGIHPKTKLPYAWPFPLKPFDQLPIVTPAQITALLEELRSILPAAKPIVTEGAAAQVSQSSLRGDPDAVRRAVEATPNTSKTFPTRESYLDYGYAIKAALPDHPEDAFELFSGWCQRWTDGENDLGVIEADWRRMKGPFRRGASWLYELAEQHSAGSFRRADAWFEEIPDEPESLFAVAPASPSEQQTDTYAFLRIGDIVNRPPPVYLVGRHIPEVSVGFLYSVPGAGKTFLALDTALHIAYGRADWHGDAIRAPDDTVVVYIAAEGSFGFRNRIAAWLKKKGITDFSQRFIMIERTIDFMSGEDINRLLRTVSSAIAARPVLIVVDTVSQAIPGADENLQKEMTLFVKACNRLKEAFRCAVLGIHHAGKDGTAMRGSTVLLGAGDFVFRLDRKSGAPVGYLRCEKQKDGPDGWSETYRFDHVGLDDGESSWVPERCEQSIGPDRAVTPDLATTVKAAIASAWEAGTPWGRTYHSKDRQASKRLVEDFGLTTAKAEELIKFWLDTGEIEEAVRSTKTGLKGLRILPTVADSAANDESVFA